MKKLTKTIMLVEDNEDDIFFMKRALSTAQITNPLVIAEDGQQAVAYLAGEPPYEDREAHPLPFLVLMDLKLPRKPGLDVLEWMRLQPALESMVVVVLTSSKETKDIDMAYRLGANSFLVKPPTAENLLALVRSLKHYWLDFNEFPVAPAKEGQRLDNP